MFKVSFLDTESMFGYKQISTFWQDFSIADAFGVDAIRDTYKRAFKSWKKDYKMLTELVLVMNWKIWQYYEKNETLAEVYNELWKDASAYAVSNLKGDELSYYFRTTD